MTEATDISFRLFKIERQLERIAIALEKGVSIKR